MFILWITGGFPVKIQQKLMRVGTLKVYTAPTVKYTKCVCPAFIMFSIRYFQFYRNICFVSASERDGLKGSLAKFGLSAGFVGFANVPESMGWIIV